MEGSGCEGVGDREMEEDRKGRTEGGGGKGRKEGKERECVCV